MPTAAAVHLAETEARRNVYADILSQAVTGELIGMANYAAMAELCGDPESQEDAVEHAYNERGHAAAFRRLAKDLGVPIIVDPAAPYWRRIREAFLRQVRAGDLSACLIVQELMLESFAVSMYLAVAEAADGKMSQVFRAISKEEEGHLQHAIDELTPELHRDAAAFEAKVGRLHDEVMTILAEMVAARDPAGACGLCRGECVKGSLHHIGLTAPELRGRALNYYLKVLDRMGIGGEVSLSWVANLPV
ncbi:MAG: long-chain fatty aldehyde decarbonylase [Deltaproteobacteria bacterium]